MGKRNQIIAIARFLAYKAQLNALLDGMSEEDYMKNPIGLDVRFYIDDLMKYCSEETVDKVLKNQDGFITRLDMGHLSMLSSMPYEEGVVPNA